MAGAERLRPLLEESMMREAVIAYRDGKLEAREQNDVWTVRLANLEVRAGYLDLALAELLGNAPEAHRAAARLLSELADVVERTGLPEETIERLIRTGALDSLGRPRRELLWQLREVAGSARGRVDGKALRVAKQARGRRSASAGRPLDLRLPATDAPELPPITEVERLGDAYAVVGLDAKRQVIEGYRERHGLAWSDHRLTAIDLQYHDLRPGRSLFARMPMERLVDEGEVIEAMTEPPRDTRAYFRGRCLQRWASSVAAANWDSLVFDLGSDPLRRVPMMEPLRGTAAHVDNLLAGCSSPAELLEQLGS